MHLYHAALGEKDVEWFEIAVEDRIGFDPKHLDQIFLPFVRLRANGLMAAVLDWCQRSWITTAGASLLKARRAGLLYHQAAKPSRRVFGPAANSAVQVFGNFPSKGQSNNNRSPV